MSSDKGVMVVVMQQMTIFNFIEKASKFYEGEYLKGQGFKNIYDEKPPTPGLYEWRDIEQPENGKILEYTESGSIHYGRLAMGKFRACWWRPLREG
jgi:hypothetical protein